MTSKYAVFSYEHENKSVPVGVALWSEERQSYGLKMLDQKDRIRGFRNDLSWRFLALAKDQLKYWETAGIPYGGDAKPWSDTWWRVVRGVFVHELQLSEARTIDTDEPTKAVDALFESVVAPHRHETARATRIAGIVHEALGDLASCFDYRAPMPGYGNRSVRVMRAYQGRYGAVVVEGLNLSVHGQADINTWQVLGKLRLLLAGPDRKRVAVVVGYLPSPEGLNGEKALVECLREETGADVFDLRTQPAILCKTVRDRVSESNGQGKMGV
jgi:hypothetical protein